MRIGILTLLLFLSSMQACAHGSGAGASGSSRAEITLEELTETGATDAYEVVDQLRPEWFRTRNPAHYVVVFYNNAEYGGVASLRNLAVDQIGRLEYMDRGQAQIEFTSRTGEFVAGVIRVYSTGAIPSRERGESATDTIRVGVTFSFYPLSGDITQGRPLREGEFAEADWTESLGDHPASMMGTMRVHGERFLSGELVVGRLLGSQRGSFERGIRNVHLGYTSTMIGLLAAHERGPFRLGVGWGAEFTTLNWAAGRCECLAAGSESSVLPGPVVDLAVRTGEARRLFVEARAHGRFFRTAEMQSLVDTPYLDFGGTSGFVTIGGGVRLGRVR